MIAVTDLAKRFGPTTAVDGITFSAVPGRLTALLGRNGAGKSTTLRILAGLVRADRGSATIGGQPYRDLRDPMRTVGVVVEDATFHPARTARRHLTALAVAGGVPRPRVDEVLALVDLVADADRRVGRYSHGMRQRLSLAAALLGDPVVLLLDEPHNGLDPFGVSWLRGQLRSFVAEGRCVLVSSHLLAEMAEIADDVAIVDRGRLIVQAPMAELLGTGWAPTATAHRLERVFFGLTGPGGGGGERS